MLSEEEYVQAPHDLLDDRGPAPPAVFPLLEEALSMLGGHPMEVGGEIEVMRREVVDGDLGSYVRMTSSRRAVVRARS